VKREEALVEKARREKARRKLLAFVRYTFPAYLPAPHLHRLAERLEAVERGKCLRLMVFMPPRHGKSELTSVRFPAWYLGRNPDKPVILASYAASLAESKSRECRAVVEGPAYERLFGKLSCVDEPVHLGEARAVKSWRIEGHRGGLLAVGVGGGITGQSAKLILIDDPVKNRAEANSLTVREGIWGWYTSSARTRAEADTAIVLIMTRWHEDDLAGRLLQAAKLDPEADQWEVLHLPAIGDDGAALWPERFSIDELRRIEASIGDWEFEALYQGNPRPPKGALFERQWFSTIVDEAPPELRWVRFWDIAATVEETGDPTAGGLVSGLDPDGVMYIGDMVWERKEWPDVYDLIKQAALLDGPGVTVGVESVMLQKGMIQELMRDPKLIGHTIVGVPVDRDKKQRASPWAQRAKMRKVALVKGPWVGPFLNEICAFPFGANDDRVDAVSGAVQMLATSGVGFADVPQAETERSRWAVGGGKG